MVLRKVTFAGETAEWVALCAEGRRGAFCGTKGEIHVTRYLLATAAGARASQLYHVQHKYRSS